MATDQRKHMLHGPLIPTGHPKPCFDMNPWHVETPASTYVHRNESKPGYKGQVWIPPPCPKMVKCIWISLDVSYYLPSV